MAEEAVCCRCFRREVMGRGTVEEVEWSRAEVVGKSIAVVGEKNNVAVEEEGTAAGEADEADETVGKSTVVGKSIVVGTSTVVG